MHRDHHIRYKTVSATLDMFTLGVLWLGLSGLRSRVAMTDLPGGLVLQPVDFGWHAALLPVVVIAWMLALAQQGAWEPHQLQGSRRLTLTLTRAAVVATLLALGLLFALQATDTLSRTLVFGHSISAIPVLLTTRRVRKWLHRSKPGQERFWRLLIVGQVRDAERLRSALEQAPADDIEVIGLVTPTPLAANAPAIPVLGHLDQLADILAGTPVDQVLLAPQRWSVDTLRTVADVCEEQGIRLSMDANFLGLTTARAHIDEFGAQTILSFSSTPVDSDALMLKRCIDITGAALLLVGLSPLMLAAAALIRMADRGPALFVQTRAGLHGRPFRMFKFRSMVVNAEQQSDEIQHLNELDGPVFKAKNDPRITKLGSILRRSSIDELPQLWNVLVGEMSLVGPRPPLPAEVQKYARWQRRRLSMKPGLTCIWQVESRGQSTDFDSWMRQDLSYIDNWSLTLDLVLLARTVPAVLSGRGAK